jgi:hypothetical protein
MSSPQNEEVPNPAVVFLDGWGESIIPPDSAGNPITFLTTPTSAALSDSSEGLSASGRRV